MTIKVALRQKVISKGRKSLYLDFYPAIPHPKTGEPTRREFLGLYVFEKVNNPIDKQHNADTLKIAASIRQKRENYLNKPEIYSQFEKDQLRAKELGEQSFIDYFKKLTNKKKGNTKHSWTSALNYIVTFTGGELKFADLNQKLLENFKDYLLTTKSFRSNKTPLAQNSASSYFNKIKAGIKQAFQDEILLTDLNSKISPIKTEETRREYLTIAELNNLVKTPCKDEVLKRAAIFSAMTGLRFSDIHKLQWNELEYIESQGYILNFKQKKTKSIEVHPISDQAYNLIGGGNKPQQIQQDTLVFVGLKYSAYKNDILKGWIESAGITKKITFHCFRHTYATLLAYGNTNPGTVQKMLGHKNIKTTMLYFHIVDQLKREASNVINLDIKS
ncbi:tyrosine-type recombinase/integrase [Algoriphagus machipongonensis]|uniref:Mobilizable transposon, int protein n=1 Tax=Algoriphagus machipongonensis TaxID=388413 RepID=A3HT74_9BACT|nr:site-specific integrase [Algoriphagus machipongonensis]EAZ83042.1 mobilizable transposon, int protein [Algoriphagus machipongonensis]